VLPQIAERVLAGGGRLLVVSADGARLAALDRALWDYAPDSFLPHALAGAGDDAAQPVLLADAVTPANGARHVALADGRWREEALGFDRAFHLFDDATLADARTAWRGLGGREGVERRYWKQKDGGGWEQAG
jgi:DNA polymerase-3 subunit chi